MQVWKRPQRHVFLTGSLEKNPPPVDYRPRLLNLLKHLNNASLGFESLPIEGRACPFGNELNPATWDSWRGLYGNLHFVDEVLKSDFGCQQGVICDHPAMSRPANQAINWLGVYVPRLLNWMAKKNLQKAQRIPNLPAQFVEVITKAEERVKKEIQSITSDFQALHQKLGTPPGEATGESGESNSLKGKRKPGRPPGGRDQEENIKLYQDWKAAHSSTGITKAEFVRGRSLPATALTHIERGRKAIQRRQPGQNESGRI